MLSEQDTEAMLAALRAGATIVLRGLSYRYAFSFLALFVATTGNARIPADLNGFDLDAPFAGGLSTDDRTLQGHVVLVRGGD